MTELTVMMELMIYTVSSWIWKHLILGKEARRSGS